LNSLTGKAIYLIGLNFIKYAIGFLVPIFIARILSKHEYGTYQQVLLLINTLSGTMVLGVPTSIYYYYNLHKNDLHKKTLVMQSFIILNISALITVIAVNVARYSIASSLGNERLIELIPILSVYIYCFIVSEYYFHLLVSKDQYTKSVIFGVSESLLRSALVLSAAFIYQDVLALVIAISIYAFARYSYSVYGSSEDFVSLKIFKAHQYVKKQILYSLPLAFTALVGLVGRMVDRYLITLHYTTSQFAVYTVGAIELPLDVIFQGSVANVLRTKIPRLVVEEKYSEVTALISEATRKLALIILPIFMYLLFYGKDFILILFTDKYTESVDVFIIYLMLTPLHIFILSVVPQSFGLTGIGFKIASFTILSNVVLSIILLKTIGFLGPAVSTVLTTYMSVIIYLYIVKKLLHKRIVDFVPVSEIIKVLALCFLLLLVLHNLHISGLRTVDFFINGIIYVSCFIVIAWLTNIFKNADKDMVISIRKRIPKYIGR